MPLGERSSQPRKGIHPEGGPSPRGTVARALRERQMRREWCRWRGKCVVLAAPKVEVGDRVTKGNSSSRIWCDGHGSLHIAGLNDALVVNIKR